VDGDQGGPVALVGDDVPDGEPPLVQRAHPLRHHPQIGVLAAVDAGHRVVAGDVPDDVVGDGIPVRARVA
jgi:hypothetical protein